MLRERSFDRLRRAATRFRSAQAARAGARHFARRIGTRPRAGARVIHQGRARHDHRPDWAARRRQVDACLGTRAQGACAGQKRRRRFGRSQLAVLARRVAGRSHSPLRAFYRRVGFHPFYGQPRSSRRTLRRDRRRGAADGCVRLGRDRNRNGRRRTERGRRCGVGTDDAGRIAARQRRFDSGAQSRYHGDRRRFRRQQVGPSDGRPTAPRDPLDDGDAAVYRLGSRTGRDAGALRRRY